MKSAYSNQFSAYLSIRKRDYASPTALNSCIRKIKYKNSTADFNNQIFCYIIFKEGGNLNE